MASVSITLTNPKTTPRTGSLNGLLTEVYDALNEIKDVAKNVRDAGDAYARLGRIYAKADIALTVFDW